MSCSCHNNPCSCYSGAETECGDPGMDTAGKHIVVLDSQFCERRLQNVNGFLYYGSNGLAFSSEPRVPLTELEVAEGDTFGDMVICTGSNGIFRRVVPAAGVDGFLKADGAGRLTFEDPSSSTIPDPLTLDTLNVTTLNVTDINSSGTPTFNALQTDTIVSVIGLNGSSQLVKGTQQTISVASFYEINDLTGAGTPNYTYPAGASSYVTIGNEITDADAIASVQDSETIRIDKAGDFTIEWRGQYTGGNPNGGNSAGTSYLPGLWLTINGVVVDVGNRQVYQDRNIGGLAYGKYVALSMNVGDLVRLRGNGSMRPSAGDGNGTGLRGAGVILTKFK
jgi:hypothetical protein